MILYYFYIEKIQKKNQFFWNNKKNFNLLTLLCFFLIYIYLKIPYVLRTMVEKPNSVILPCR